MSSAFERTRIEVHRDRPTKVSQMVDRSPMVSPSVVGAANARQVKATIASTIGAFEAVNQ
jgi:hypothetical protein